MDVLAALQNSIEIVGKLRALSKKAEDAEFKMLVADLSNELADAKLEVVGLKEELISSRSAALQNLTAECQALRAEVAARNAEVAALERQVQVLTDRLSPSGATQLEDVPERMLLALTEHEELTEDDLASLTNGNKHIAAYHLEVLRKMNFVHASHTMGSEWSGDPPRTDWSIGHNGREYLIRRGLLA